MTSVAEIQDGTLEEPSDPTLVQLDNIEDRLIMLERKVNEIHEFAVKLAGVLDAMAGNPMIAAMLPPGIFPVDTE